MSEEESRKQETSADESTTGPETEGKHVDEGWKEQVAREKENLKHKEESKPSETKEDRGESLPPASFVSFVASLAAQALIQLGEIEHPATGKPQVDLEGARYSVDLLSMLKEKTKGNLTPDEERHLDGVLFEIRMRFVRATQDASGAGTAGEAGEPTPGPGPQA